MHGRGDKLEEKREPRGRDQREIIFVLFFPPVKEGVSLGKRSARHASAKLREVGGAGTKQSWSWSCPEARVRNTTVEGLWVQEPGLASARGCGIATPARCYQVSAMPCPGRGKEKQGRPFPSAVWWLDIVSIIVFPRLCLCSC